MGGRRKAMSVTVVCIKVVKGKADKSTERGSVHKEQ